MPLISPSYLRSEWCMREWALFSARRVVPREPGAPGNASAIVPVIWVPTDRSQMPEELRGIQEFAPHGLANPRIAAEYLGNGIYGLLRTKQEEAYQHVVWRLSMRIREICLRYHIEVAMPEATS